MMTMSLQIRTGHPQFGLAGRHRLGLKIEHKWRVTLGRCCKMVSELDLERIERETLTRRAKPHSESGVSQRQPRP